MNGNSTRLSVSPVGRAVAYSILHPRSADQLIEFVADRANDLLALADDEAREIVFCYALLHAAYSSHEYEPRGSNRTLPYQLNVLIQNTLADVSENYLIEYPWTSNPKAANAALVATRWVEGCPRNELATEFDVIGSGVIQTMIREGAEILFAWSDCLIASTGRNLVEGDQPSAVRGDRDLLRAVRRLATDIRAQAGLVASGLPGEAAWMSELVTSGGNGMGRRLLTRPAIMALYRCGLTDPLELLRGETFKEIINTLKPLALPDLDSLVRDLRDAVRAYRQRQRAMLWHTATERAPENVAAILQDMESTRGKPFEKRVEDLLAAADIAYQRLDDGKTPGAADLRIGLSDTADLVVELKTTQGEETIGLNEATDVVKGAAIVDLAHLPKVTVANPGFDANVPWQARRVSDLALVEACHFGYGISLVARGEIDKDTFLDWLAQPGSNPIPVYRAS